MLEHADDLPLVRMAEREIEPDAIEAFSAMLAEEIEASVEKEAGVLAIQAVVLPDAPNHVRILEVYASQAAYEEHLQSAHFLAYKTGTAAMVKSLRLMPVEPVRLRAKPLDL